eukprot:864366-Prymnesium_polylepis.2
MRLRESAESHLLSQGECQCHERLDVVSTAGEQVHGHSRGFLDGRIWRLRRHLAPSATRITASRRRVGRQSRFGLRTRDVMKVRGRFPVEFSY